MVGFEFICSQPGAVRLALRNSRYAITHAQFAIYLAGVEFNSSDGDP